MLTGPTRWSLDPAGTLAAGVLSLGLVGCYAGLGAGDRDAGSEDSSGGSDGSSDGGAGVCDVVPGRVGLQRLTRAEYNRTVRDLFGITSAPADAFPPDSATNGFDNNAKSLTISPQLAALLLDAAETIAAEAIANDTGSIVSCDPAQNDACARTILEGLALRVYRRPATQSEIADLVRLVEVAQSEGDGFNKSIEYALTAMLVAPQFLYRSIPSAGGAPPAGGDIVALDDWRSRPVCRTSCGEARRTTRCWPALPTLG